MSNVRASGINTAWDNSKSCVKGRWLPRPASGVKSPLESSVPLRSAHESLEYLPRARTRITHLRRSRHLVSEHVQHQFASPESPSSLPNSPVHQLTNRDERPMGSARYLSMADYSQRLSRRSIRVPLSSTGNSPACKVRQAHIIRDMCPERSRPFRHVEWARL
jgi:hypothetical protein